MKKFLLRLLLFLVVAYLGQLALYFGFKRFLDRESQFRMTRYFRSPVHKYFVLGNSRGVNSINEKFAVEDLHLDLINLSYNGEPYANILDMLSDVNMRNRNAVIFLEISGLSNDAFDGAYSYYMANSEWIAKRYAGTVFGKIDLLRFDNEFFLRNIYYLRKSDNDWINRNTITPAIIREIRDSPGDTIFPNYREFQNRLAETTRICAAHGNKIVYFLAPYYPAYLAKMKDYEDVVDFFVVHSNMYNFIDLNKVGLPGQMFADRVHSNYRGSILLTDTLISLSKRFAL